MNNLEKLKQLKNLYLLKSLGFQYEDMPKIAKKREFALENDLDKLKQSVMKCSLCELSKYRKNIVFGEGNRDAKIMFIGEGPGAVEDEIGKPFVGRAGQLLTDMIHNVLGIKREEVYIANIVKCRPPNNRVPTESEAECCMPYLLKQMEIVNPTLVVALGATAYRYLTHDKTPISQVRGEILKLKDYTLIPTYHPSFLLRNPSAKKEAYLDLLKIKRFL
ncbi:MAG: uracil-DNA glycosylase [Campylobacterales bacterium]|nr:uracil-DNA glycosylase [Campylobacterales bacterium]